MISKVLILVFVIASAQCKNWHEFMRKYATAKGQTDRAISSGFEVVVKVKDGILGECFGEQFMTEWHKNFTQAVKYCESQSSEDQLKNIPLNEYPIHDVTFEQMTFPADSIFPGQVPADPSLAAIPGAMPSAGISDINNLAAALQANLTQPILLVPLPLPLLREISDLTTGNFLLRKKRDNHDEEQKEPVFDAERIKKIYQKMQDKTGNFTCVVKKLGMFNEAFDVNVQKMVGQYNNLELEADLRVDIHEGVMDCLKFATCKPLNRMSLTPPVIQRAKAFLKCEGKQRVASCVKNDLKKMQSKFDSQALEDLPAGNDVDEGDKMIAILWGEFEKE